MRDKLIDLTDSGVFEFVYTDRHSIVLFFLREVDNQLYRVTTDKNYEVLSIDLIITPKLFNGYTDLKFFKPFPANVDGYVYTGVFKQGDKYHKFTIDNEEMHVKENFDYEDKSDLQNLKSLDEFSLQASIRKRDRLFFVGSDRESGDCVHGIINIEKDVVEKVNFLYTDEGEITLKTINIDTIDQHIYIAGYREYNGVKSPYFETNLLPR